MLFMIVAVSAVLFVYGSFRSWRRYRHRLIQHYPSRRR
ncbi:response regulator [Pantoea eucrina]|uniref:Response regulator n=1 Tax=Pantoea eucrina TaxID=472693 RepID=A0ABU5LD41_9GAMM|nr:response regulator [Pantoea eucrina]MDZ7277867.1 response regulator [Pantoea eucrina]